MKTATARQLNAAKERMKQKIAAVRAEWTESNPEPSWEVEQAWLTRHSSPKTKHSRGKAKAVKPLVDKMNALLFDAKMGRLDADAFYALVQQF